MKWTVVIALVWLLAAALATFIEEYERGVIFALIGIGAAIISLHERG